MKNKIIRIASITLALALFFECVLFNWGHWETLQYGDSDIAPEITYGSGLVVEGDSVTVTDPSNSYIELSHVEDDVENLYFGVTSVNKKNSVLPIILEATDIANAYYFSLPETEVTPSLVGTKYIDLHLAKGGGAQIKINVQASMGTIFSFDSISLNKQQPFSFSVLRFGIIWFALLFLAVIRPGSSIYTRKVDWVARSTKFVLVTIAVVQIMALFAMSYRGLAVYDEWGADAEYNHLTDAFLSGSVVLDKQAPEFLKSLDNPYDVSSRSNYLASINNLKMADEFTDYAYYDGKFYCYFGALPALLLFAPFKVLTGCDLPTWVSVFFFGACLLIGIKLLLYEILVRLLHQKTNLGLFVLMDLLFVGACGLLYLGYLPTTYSVPIVAGLAFAVWGLACWLMAKRGCDSCSFVSTSEANFTPSQSLSKPLLVAGALCIALTLGCRQSYIVVALLAFPIFWNEITKSREFFSKKGLGNTACVLIPFIVVAVVAMWYNYARFGSFFDFGATYNLTSNDMTHRGFVFDRFPLGVYLYLFQPCSFVAAFPFMTVTSTVSDYQGYTSVEPMFGGFLFINVLVLITALVFLRKYKIEFSARLFAIVSCFLGLFLMLFDIQASGITARYVSDFAWLLLLPTIIVVFNVWKQISSKYPLSACGGNYALGLNPAKVLLVVLIGLVLLSFALNVGCLFIEGRFSPLATGKYAPYLFYMVKDSLSFLW